MEMIGFLVSRRISQAEQKLLISEQSIYTMTQAHVVLQTDSMILIKMLECYLLWLAPSYHNPRMHYTI